MTQLMIDLGHTDVEVSELGGSIIRLTQSGKQILVAQYAGIGDKLRGGCHACAPWFGPSEFGDRKHGHLRDLVGEGKSHRNSADVVFRREADVRYPWTVLYGARTVIHEDGLVEMGIVMRRENDGESRLAPVNPAFHPYYACDTENVCVIVNGRREHDFGGKARGIELNLKREVIIEMPDRRIEVSLNGAFLGRRNPWVFLWTDSPREYLCVEPVLYDPREFNTPKGLFLDIGQDIEVEMGLNIHLK